MAKKIDKATATAKVTARDVWNKKIGEFIATEIGEDTDRLKEGILISTDDGDIVVKIILKKDEIQYTEDDVIEVYTAPEETE